MSEDRRLRVAIVSDVDHRSPYGSFQRVAGISCGLAGMADVSLAGIELEPIGGIGVHSTHTRRLPAFMGRIAEFVRSTRPDVVYAHRNLPGFCALLLSRAGIVSRDMPLVFDFHSSAVLEYTSLGGRDAHGLNASMKIRKNAFVERSILSSGHAAIAVSTELASFLKERYGCSHSVSVIPSGVPDAYLVAPVSPRDPFRDSSADFRILLVAPGGFASNDLAVEFAGEVASILSARQSASEIFIAGGGREPGYRDKMHFLGFVDDIMPFIDHADACILPYPDRAVCGGIRTKALEFLARGKIVVATGQGASGLSDLEAGVSFLLSPDDPAAFAEILLAIAREPGTFSRIGEIGRARIMGKYSYSEIAKRVYNVLLEESGGR